MALNTKLGTSGRNAAASAIGTLLNSGRIEHRTGAPPTNVSDASSGTLLGTNTLNATAFGAASNGTITANAITNDSSADASGVAGYWRAYASGGADTAAIIQGTSGEAGDTPDLVWNNKTVVAGGVLAITAFTITVPVQ